MIGAEAVDFSFFIIGTGILLILAVLAFIAGFEPTDFDD